MQEYKKYDLTFDESYKYLMNYLKDGNIIAQQLRKKIDFVQGQFFALLSNKADMDKVYKFTAGGIIPPEQITEKIILGKKYKARSQTSSINELKLFIKHKTNSSRYCIFEDVLRYKSDSNIVIPQVYNLYYHNDVYYLLDLKNFDDELGVKLIKHSDAMWYFMCILAKEPLEEMNISLSLEQVNEICKKVTTIVIGAYDGEGYIIWEKKS